jgi:plastocyanin
VSHKSRLLATLAIVPLALASCSGANTHGAHTSGTARVQAQRGSDGVQQVTVDSTNMFRFVPAAINAHVGKLRVVLTDHGSYPHNISFPALHATSRAVSGNLGQQRTTLTISLNHTGIYDFVCTFHSSAGMKGEITVS